jgi:hypothetical protein
MPLTKRLPSPVRPGSRLVRGGDEDPWSIGREGMNAEGSTGPKRRFPRKHRNPRQVLPFMAPRSCRNPHGGVVKKTPVTTLIVMLLSSLMFAQRAVSRATTGTTTTSSSGSCTRTSSTSTGTTTSSASQHTQSLSTPSVLATRSKAAAVFEAMHVVRASQSPSTSTGTSSGVLLPSTVVPFR